MAEEEKTEEEKEQKRKEILRAVFAYLAESGYD